MCASAGSNLIAPTTQARDSNARWVILAPLLASRPASLLLAVGGTFQVIAGVFHLPGMPCPVARLFGVPCPGCGASRACGALLRGEWRDAFRLHAFAPMFLCAVLLFWAASLLPVREREALDTALRRFEARSALPALLLVIAVLYWLLRLIYAPTDLIHRLAS